MFLMQYNEKFPNRTMVVKHLMDGRLECVDGRNEKGFSLGVGETKIFVQTEMNH